MYAVSWPGPAKGQSPRERSILDVMVLPPSARSRVRPSAARTVNHRGWLLLVAGETLLDLFRDVNRQATH